MKKFITFAPQQEKLGKTNYIVQNNLRLEFGETRFPIMPVINGYLEKNEEYKIIAVVAEHEFMIRNTDYLKEEIENLCEKKGIRYDEKTNFEEIRVAFDDGIETQLSIFQMIIQKLQDGDELYACITYGSKPAEIVELMALRYARQIKKNVYIGCVVYGQVDWKMKTSKIFDLTALLHLDDIVHTVSEMQGINPEEVLKDIIAD